jgi:hypothetical protein
MRAQIRLRDTDGVARVGGCGPTEAGLAAVARFFRKNLDVEFGGARRFGHCKGVKGRHALAASSKIDARPGANEVLCSGGDGSPQEQRVIFAACDVEGGALGIEKQRVLAHGLREDALVQAGHKDGFEAHARGLCKRTDKYRAVAGSVLLIPAAGQFGLQRCENVGERHESDRSHRLKLLQHGVHGDRTIKSAQW